LRQADANTGVRFLYKLRGGERWTLLDRDRVMVVHPDQPAKLVCPHGQVEEIASKTGARTKPPCSVAHSRFPA